MNKEFEVEVVSRQRAMYRVAAPDAATAEKVAVERWQQKQPSEVSGVDWSELESAYAAPAPDDIRDAQDEELVLRFIREREALLMRLGGEMMSASINDAISASQAAADLGWRRPGAGNSPDAIRAAKALERLCGKRRLVCFERTRVRSGERGEIRLYCTPEYLEGLSAGLDADPRQAAR